MLPAAVLLPRALVAIEELLLAERAGLRRLGLAYLRWLSGQGAVAPASEQQRRYALLRLRLNEHLSTLDLFSDAITQRSESAVGLWLSGMDVAAADALRLNDGRLGDEVPIICYLDRGPGAAIRRARTRLPDGEANPVAVVRIPRERMVGHGIASSLFHEVGHQGAALLDLVASVRAELAGYGGFEYRLWSSWISEILADFWSVARLGIGSTLGLMGVVSLPRPFVFRFSPTDPHPFPWIRVLLSAAIGQQLYPDPQWAAVRRLWWQLYPPPAGAALRRLLSGLPDLAALLARHRPASLGGMTLARALAHPSRRPGDLRRLGAVTARTPAALGRLRPALRFALLGQARWDGRLSAAAESREVDAMLRGWARGSTLRMAAAATRQQPWALAPAATA
jgi:hypothetical protein